MGRLSWLFGGNDHELAATQYANRESATERANRRERSSDRAARSRSATRAAREGQAWEDQDRQRHTTTRWFRTR